MDVLLLLLETVRRVSRGLLLLEALRCVTHGLLVSASASGLVGQAEVDWMGVLLILSYF